MHASKAEILSPQKTAYADINGIRMYYEIYGSGKPMILIHGGGSTIQTTFGRIIPVLADSFQLIAVELQAHGHTSDRAADLSFEQDAEDVAGLMKSLAVKEAHIFGFSNGATTAIYLAAKYPELCDKLIAASGLYKRDGVFPQFWDFMKSASIDQMPQQYKDAYMKIHPDKKMLQNMHDKCAQRMINFKDVKDEILKSVKAPVLLVAGDKDVPTIEHMAAISKILPKASVAIIPGGHGDFMGEITTMDSNEIPQLEILAILERFLEE